MLFIARKQQKIILNFYLDSLNEFSIVVMEHQKISILLSEANDYKSVKRKWNIGNDNSNSNYDVENEIIYDAEVLKFYLCDYNDTYILGRGNITIKEHQAIQVAFRN